MTGSPSLDISAAVLYYPLTAGVKVLTLLQGIASGFLGQKAFAAASIRRRSAWRSTT
jgi:hypothetical protein